MASAGLHSSYNRFETPSSLALAAQPASKLGPSNDIKAGMMHLAQRPVGCKAPAGKSLPISCSATRSHLTRAQRLGQVVGPTQAPTDNKANVAATIEPTASVSRRTAGMVAIALALTPSYALPGPASADDFVNTPSGLKYLDVKLGQGATPKPGDTVVVHWAGYTKGYQGKRIDNTSTRDEPYEFVLGSKQAIAAFEEAVSSMSVGGIRRVEVRGERPELGYPLERSERFTNELLPSKEGKIYKYRYGPQPIELSGQRALDFVLDNKTLNDFNRTLLFDIKLLAVRPARSKAATCVTPAVPC